MSDSIYSKYATKPSEVTSRLTPLPERLEPDVAATRHPRFKQELEEPEFSLPPGWVNRYQALRDMVEHLEAYEPSRQRDIATGMIVAVSQIAPQSLSRFMDLLRALPMCADTADSFLESLQFMNSHDRTR